RSKTARPPRLKLDEFIRSRGGVTRVEGEIRVGDLYNPTLGSGKDLRQIPGGVTDADIELGVADDLHAGDDGEPFGDGRAVHPERPVEARLVRLGVDRAPILEGDVLLQGEVVHGSV